MASAANRLNAGQHRTPDEVGQGTAAAVLVCGSRFLSGSTRVPNASGRTPRKSWIGLADPIYRMNSVGAIQGECQFHATGNPQLGYDQKNVAGPMR
jgi:hypothetical protein